MVAAPSVDGAAHRIDHEPVRYRRLLDECVELPRRAELLLGASVCDQFDPMEEPGLRISPTL
jgi:hypothetical protein